MNEGLAEDLVHLPVLLLALLRAVACVLTASAAFRSRIVAGKAYGCR